MPAIPAREGLLGWCSKKLDLISKITRGKEAGGVAHVIGHLPSKCEALSSNPSIAKKQTKVE
jgi:hypothetical protein